jgi:hypothetical protein
VAIKKRNGHQNRKDKASTRFRSMSRRSRAQRNTPTRPNPRNQARKN